MPDLGSRSFVHLPTGGAVQNLSLFPPSPLSLDLPPAPLESLFFLFSLSSPSLGSRGHARARQGVWIRHGARVRRRGNGALRREGAFVLVRGLERGLEGAESASGGEQGCVTLLSHCAQGPAGCQLGRGTQDLRVG